MVGKIYQVILVENPTREEMREADALSKILAGPLQVIARDENSASMKAGALFSTNFELGDRTECVVIEAC